MKTVAMSFSKFFNTPSDSVTQNLNDFYNNLGEANRIMDEIRKQNEYNLKIIDDCNKILNSPTPSNNINLPSANSNPLVDKVNTTDHSFWGDFIDRGTQNSVPKNTPNTSLIEQMSKFNDRIDSIGKKIEAFNYYLDHPILIAKVIILGIGTASYYICMTICLWCIIIYVLSESEKVKQTGYITFGIYVALQVLSRCFQAFV